MRRQRESNRGNICHASESVMALNQHVVHVGRGVVRVGNGSVCAYFRRIERKVFSLDDSSGAFSGVGVDDIVDSGGASRKINKP